MQRQLVITIYRQITPQSSPLLSLPAELILRLFPSLKLREYIYLQHLLADGKHEVFRHPLFSVCRELRVLGLETFYRCNQFIFQFGYFKDAPKQKFIFKDHQPNCSPMGPLMSTQPSMYPQIFQNLRCIHIKLFLDRNTEKWHQHYANLLADLEQFSALLERGHMLSQQHSIIMTDQRKDDVPLSEAQRKVLSVLFRMEVEGNEGSLTAKMVDMPDRFVSDIMALAESIEIETGRRTP